MRKVPVAERFWTRVDTSNPDACWDWRGSLNQYGYGRVKANGKNAYAHRVSLSLTMDIPIEDVPIVDHLCENRRCVNPAHLDPTTHSQNRSRSIW